MRCLHCWKSMTLITPKTQTILIKTKDAPKIHIVDFKKIQEEKQKKMNASRAFLFKTE